MRLRKRAPGQCMPPAETAPRLMRPRLWYLTTAASVAIGVVPIWVLETWFGVPRKISVGYGIVAYAIGTVCLKLPLHAFVVERVLRKHLTVRWQAVSMGVLSAVSELAPTVPFFVYVIPHATWWQLVGFGVGAGAAEAIMVPFITNPFKGTSLGEHADAVYRASAGRPAIQWMSVLERVWAMLLQTSTRGLVGLAVLRVDPVPAAVAVASFATVDATAYYWHLRQWRFDVLPVLVRVHLFLACMAGLTGAAFLWWARAVIAR